MVEVVISQLYSECNVWREKLRIYREELNNDETQLRQIAGQELTKEQLQDVEHLHNQFHIQLINIHDLKQAIKAHDRRMNFEKVAFNGHVNEDRFSRRRSINDKKIIDGAAINRIRAPATNQLHQYRSFPSTHDLLCSLTGKVRFVFSGMAVSAIGIRPQSRTN